MLVLFIVAVKSEILEFKLPSCKLMEIVQVKYSWSLALVRMLITFEINIVTSQSLVFSLSTREPEPFQVSFMP